MGLSGFLADLVRKDTKESAMRFSFLTLTVMPVVCVMTVWTSLSLYYGAMQTVDASVISLLTLLGVSGAGFKVWQNGQENQDKKDERANVCTPVK
jgi:exosortase/archaeosortase